MVCAAAAAAHESKRSACFIRMDTMVLSNYSDADGDACTDDKTRPPAYIRFNPAAGPKWRQKLAPFEYVTIKIGAASPLPRKFTSSWRPNQPLRKALRWSTLSSA